MMIKGKGGGFRTIGPNHEKRNISRILMDTIIMGDELLLWLKDDKEAADCNKSTSLITSSGLMGYL